MNALVTEINDSWKSNLSLKKLLLGTVHPTWIHFFTNSGLLDMFTDLESLLKTELDTYGSGIAILPRPENVFKAFSQPIDKIKVVIIGQDVYPNIRKVNDSFQEEAMGLSFSVPKSLKIPPSLRNIYKELKRTHQKEYSNGDLTNWSEQGVLLLNSALTVRQMAAGSHLKAWSKWTDKFISALSQERQDLTYLLWGNFAKGKKKFILHSKKILESGHPSPLNRSNPFIGCGHFKAVSEINW